MKSKNHISYYCFNKACQGSVYHDDSIVIADLPFNAHTLASDHYCSLCKTKLISIMDIDVRLALTKSRKVPVLFG